MADALVEKFSRKQAIDIRRLNLGLESNARELHGKVLHVGKDAKVCARDNLEYIILQIESDDGHVIAINLTRKMLKRFKADYEFIFDACCTLGSMSRRMNEERRVGGSDA